MNALPKLLTVAEAAGYLGIAASTLYEKIQEGRIPAVRLWESRRKAAIRIPEAALAEFIGNRTTEPER